MKSSTKQNKRKQSEKKQLRQTKKKMRFRRNLLTVLWTILLLTGFLGFFAAKWYRDVYGNLGFDSILYTLFSDLGGVETRLILDFCLKALVPAVLGTAVCCVSAFHMPKKPVQIREKQVYPFSNGVASALCLLLTLALLWGGAVYSGLHLYIYDMFHESAIFEEKYVDPDSVEITFPEEKRNLIYIFLESMETTYQSYDLGGGNYVNLIPELTNLAQEHVSFSTSSQFSGAYQRGNTGWTIAAMLSQSSGVPLVVPPGYDGNSYGQDGKFMPGLYSLSDLLHDNGYYQMLMVGSDAAFGGRESYYTSHHTDRIYDYYDACQSGVLPSEDYYVWWGMDDLYLYECAKAELVDLAKQDQPFAFTMLTVDTHHISGYVCAKCSNEYDEQYENVISCASRQVAEFVDWLQQQDFYENTTIVICGDHLSMDNAYFSRKGYDHSLRRIYNCFINASVTPVSTKNRTFTTLDMFPTTVAALGCTIENDRLGLGTNLFSSTPTLCEELGNDVYNEELGKSTNYYFDHFFFS